MSLKVVMFDLDGTLLPMDQNAFTKKYFSLMAQKLAPYGYVPQQLIDGIWAGTAAMVKNNGCKTNETAFWDKFCSLIGEKARNDMPIFEDFYTHEFEGARSACGFDEASAKIVHACHEMGLKVVLATNPIFPAAATLRRIDWAGLLPSDFALITTYENSHFCKPNPKYYAEILEKMNVRPEECLMVGNDVDEDMIAQTLGMNVFLMPACLINRSGADISIYPNGNTAALYDYIQTLLA